MNFLSQRKYALDQLQETDMSTCQPVDTPVEEGLKLCAKSNQIPVDKGRHKTLVGKLMYLAYTRLDLAYALSIGNPFIHNHGEQHMNTVMQILRYLKVDPGKGILFTKNADFQSTDAYTDVDWVGAIDDRQSTFDYFTFIGANLDTWRSKNKMLLLAQV